MKKFILLLIYVLTGVSLAVADAAPDDREATLIDRDGTAWKITGVFIYSEPGGFYESRFCLAVVTDTFHVAIPPENLISVEVEGDHCTAEYLWMGNRQRIFGRVASKLVGGKGSLVNFTREFKDVKRLTFEKAPVVGIVEEPLTYDATLLLQDGTRVPTAKLMRVSSQAYPPAPSAGVEGGTVFELYNDVGFFQAQNAHTIKFDDIESMMFPTQNSILLTFKKRVDRTEKTQGKAAEQSRKDLSKVKGRDDQFLLEALDDLIEEKRDTGERVPKVWVYGFTGISSKGYFFIEAKHVKAIEFGTESQ